LNSIQRATKKDIVVMENCLIPLFFVCLWLSVYGFEQLVSDDLSSNDIPYEHLVSPVTTPNGSVFQDDGTEMIYRIEPNYVHVTLTIDICRYQEHIAFNHRCYNGKFVGPAIHVKQGDRVAITVVNRLGPETGEYFMNEYHFPNHTSLHVHGLHVSPFQDNSFDIIAPGENKTIVLDIPVDHYPGTHWYHSHYHGSSSYHILSGLHGAFIVEPRDPVEFYPQFFQQMREIVLVLSNLKIYSWFFAEYAGLPEEAGKVGDEIDLDLDVDTSLYNNTFAVNGKYQPPIQIAVNEWNWLRMINAGATISFAIKINSTECEHYVIGYDGVFLDEPLQKHAYYIFIGARLDLAIKCTSSGLNPVELWMDYENEWIYAGIDAAEHQVLFDLQAIDMETTNAPLPIDAYEVPTKPSYLDSLMDVTEDELAGKFEINSAYDDSGANFFFTEHDWAGQGNSTLFSLELGKVYEITFTNVFSAHPIHIHVNHMQVFQDEEVAWSTFDTHALHEPGVWRGKVKSFTTLLADFVLFFLPDTVYNVKQRNVTVRVRPDKFVGMALIHCHFVPHADRGMMAEIEILS
jgi:FtsP/CotA-like multicopper oxidase with cupredoxin domain